MGEKVIELEFKDGDDGGGNGFLLGINITVLDDESFLLVENYEETECSSSHADKAALLKYLKEIL